MLPGEILILTGTPGAGKTTLADKLARAGEGPSVHLQADSFWDAIKAGRIDPSRPESNAQNGVVIEALAAAAEAYAKGGYFVVVDGIVGPWFLPRFLAGVSAPVHYLVLRPSLELAAGRVRAREGCDALRPVVEGLHRQFADLGALEPHALAVGEESAGQVFARVGERLNTGALRLRPLPAGEGGAPWRQRWGG